MRLAVLDRWGGRRQRSGRDWRELLTALKNAWQRHRIDNVGGAVTFFGVLGLFPFLVFLLSLASLVIDARQTEELVRHLGRMAPPEVATIVAAGVRATTRQPNVGLLAFGALGAASVAPRAVRRADCVAGVA
jgi:membrane protein